jgi:tRNA-uridine 2-sulfurtransferase
MSSQRMSSESSPDRPHLTKKAVALISGGLDSALAIHLVKLQDIDVTALHFTSFFSPLSGPPEESPVAVTARQLGVPVVYLPRGDDFLDLIRAPQHGYGKNLNPCIDCRIYSFVKAKEFMREIGASFIVTGEVVGQRPMSQMKNTIRFIEKRAGCDSIILRPLSAKILPPTEVEEAGIVDREQLLEVAGRGRKVQLSLAKEIGLSGYSPPAGGCLLTDKIFSRRLKDLLDDGDDVSREDLDLLKIGRHIRLRQGLKLVVARNETENGLAENISEHLIKFLPVDFPGPVVIVKGSPEPQEELLIGSILRRYSKRSAVGESIEIHDPHSGQRSIQVTDFADEGWIADRMV